MLNSTFREEAAMASDLTGSEFFLNNFTYSNNVILNSIFNHMADTNFTGVTVGHCTALRGLHELHIHM